MTGVEALLKIDALESLTASLLGLKVPLTSWPLAWTICVSGGFAGQRSTYVDDNSGECERSLL